MNISKFSLVRRICRKISMSIIFMLLFTVAGFTLEISFLVGDVTIIRDGKKVQADMGTEMLSGDMIIAGKGGLAVLSYKDGSEIKVMENSKIRVGSKKIKDSDDLSVISGIVKGKFAKLLRGSERKVYSPTTVCSVRGTDFLVGVSDGADSRVELSEGSLDVHNPYGKAKLSGKQNADIGVTEAPRKKAGKGLPLKDWKNKKDEELMQNPKSKGEEFSSYINKFNERSSKASDNIDDFDKDQSKAATMGKKRLEKTNIELENLQLDVTDDMILNEATNSSLDGILNKFKKDKGDIYNTFQRIKEESNKVLEQQRKNYEAIEAVRAAYKKAYDEIMKEHQDYMKKLKGGFDKEKYKPKKD